MTLTDIVELAKQGYKPADVKELIALSKEPETPDDGKQKAPEKDPEQDKPEDAKEPESAKEPEGTDGEAIDYKKLYEDEKKKVSDLQKELTGKDISKDQDDHTDLDTVNDLMKSFM